MNAQVGLTKPALIGADVCHLNLHKTFASLTAEGAGSWTDRCNPTWSNSCHHTRLSGWEAKREGGIRCSLWNALVLTIAHAYVQMLGGEGLKTATEMAILNANYLVECLKGHYSVLYTGPMGALLMNASSIAGNFKQQTGVENFDIARGHGLCFHAPTLSFPVHETLMIEL